jgi:hypothetical protein
VLAILFAPGAFLAARLENMALGRCTSTAVVLANSNGKWLPVEQYGLVDMMRIVNLRLEADIEAKVVVCLLRRGRQKKLRCRDPSRQAAMTRYPVISRQRDSQAFTWSIIDLRGSSWKDRASMVLRNRMCATWKCK